MGGALRSSDCQILETVPLVMRFIRDQVRRRHASGLSLPQFRTLVFLQRAENSSLSAVAEHLGLSLPAMSRLIDGLVQDRLVQRQSVRNNRRQVALTLSRPGRATLEKVRRQIRLRLADSLQSLSAPEQKAIQRAMRVLRKVFDRHAACGNSSHNVKP